MNPICHRLGRRSTFGVVLRVFHASANAPLFRTGGFVESLATQTAVAVVSIAGALPYTPLAPLLQFVPVKTWFYRHHALL
jgi:hypothetical protein